MAKAVDDRLSTNGGRSRAAGCAAKCRDSAMRNAGISSTQVPKTSDFRPPCWGSQVVDFAIRASVRHGNLRPFVRNSQREIAAWHATQLFVPNRPMQSLALLCLHAVSTASRPNSPRVIRMSSTSHSQSPAVARNARAAPQQANLLGSWELQRVVGEGQLARVLAARPAGGPAARHPRESRWRTACGCDRRSGPCRRGSSGSVLRGGSS